MDFYDFSEQYPHLSAKASGLADWLAMDNNTPSDLVNNAIYIYMMEVTAYMADVIGESDYAQTLRERREAALKEWNEAYVDPATGKTRSADGKKIIHSQASYATPLNFNCFNEANKAKAVQYLAELDTIDEIGFDVSYSPHLRSLICPHCGKELSHKDHFCKHCGTRIY